MAIVTTNVSIEELEECVEDVLFATEKGPVFVNHGQERTHVILSHEEYRFNMRIVLSTLSDKAQKNLQSQLGLTSAFDQAPSEKPIIIIDQETVRKMRGERQVETKSDDKK